MRIYVVYEARMWPYNNKIEICEFFNSEYELRLFMINKYTPKFLESYCFPELFSPPSFDLGFTKGIDGELIIDDTRLFDYFTRLWDFYKEIKITDSMETRFINRILLDSIVEVEERLKKLESTKNNTLTEEKDDFL